MEEENKSLQQQAIDSMIHLDRRHRAKCDKAMSVYGLHRSSHRMLAHIHRRQTVTQSALAESMQISPAVVTVTLGRLEEEGYICRQTSQTDKRIQLVSLTPKGEMLVTNGRRTLQEVDALMLQGITDEEKELFIRLNMRMLKNLEGEESSQ